MIQLVILFLFVVFVIAVILLYKKYIKIKNVVDEEQDKKYNKVKEAVGSNNKRIKDMKKDAKDIVNDEGNNASSLGSRVNTNKKQIASNRNTIIDNNFETINSVFKYDNGLVIGGTAGHMRMGDDNIRLNVQNPTQARVCDANKNCTNIITKKMVEDTWPVKVGSETATGDDGGGPSVGGNGGNVVVSTDSSGSSDGYLSFDKTTSILSSTHEIIEIIFSSWNAEDRPDVTKLIESDYENKWDHSIGVLTPYGADNVTGDLFTFIKGPLSSRVVTTGSTLEVNILIKASNNTQPHKYYKFIFSLNTDRTIQLTNIIQSSIS